MGRALIETHRHTIATLFSAIKFIEFNYERNRKGILSAIRFNEVHRLTFVQATNRFPLKVSISKRFDDHKTRRDFRERREAQKKLKSRQ